MTQTLKGEFSQDYSTLSWVNGSDLRYGLHQLMTHRTWHSCERQPTKCASSPVQYGVYGPSGNKFPSTKLLTPGERYFISPNQR